MYIKHACWVLHSQLDPCIPAPPVPLYLTHTGMALMTQVVRPNCTISKGLTSLCSSWRIWAWYSPLSGLYFTVYLYQAHSAHRNPTESASLGYCNIFPMICPDLEKSSITPPGIHTHTSHVPTVSFSSAALYSQPFSTDSVPV